MTHCKYIKIIKIIIIFSVDNLLWKFQEVKILFQLKL